MGEVIDWPGRRHARASVASRAARSASAPSVIHDFPFRAARRAKASQCAAGMLSRARQLLTVESDSPRVRATCPVPPRSSMIEPAVIMAQHIVRIARTSQAFAIGETTFPVVRGQLGPMIDPPHVIGKRLKTLRKALNFPTQSAFAEAIGVEKNTYNPWEKGDDPLRPLTFEGAILIKRQFRISLDYLFFGETDGLTVAMIKKIAEAA